jgi:hypothetical protein
VVTLVGSLGESIPTLVGIDHGFSFPMRYFEVNGLRRDWSAFLDDFQRHWLTDEDHTYVDFVRDDIRGNGAHGHVARWLSLADHADTLVAFMNPALTPSERATAEVEGGYWASPGRGSVPYLNPQSAAGDDDRAVAAADQTSASVRPALARRHPAKPRSLS